MDDQNADPVVLLVDDGEMERFLHRQALEPGFEIVDAQGGVAALEAFAISLHDVVVLDPMMPDMDGFAVCRAIRAGSNIPVPSGLDDVELVERPIGCLPRRQESSWTHRIMTRE